MCIYPNASWGRVAFIYLQCNASIIRGLQEATEHFRPSTTLTPLRSEQPEKQNTKYTRTVIQDLLIT